MSHKVVGILQKIYSLKIASYIFQLVLHVMFVLKKTHKLPQFCKATWTDLT